MPAARSLGSLRKPTVARCFLLATGSLIFAATARAQDPASDDALTEREAVTRALQRSSLVDAVEGEVAIEEGRARAASAAPNPELSYTRAQTFGAFGTSEDSLSVAQVFDLGNRRGLRREAGVARARAARRSSEAARLEVVAEVQLRFYEVLYRQERVAALQAWGARIEAALAVVARRERRGDAAAYDRRRLERERAVATGRLESERATAERAAGRLRGLLAARDGSARVTGRLLPDDEPGSLESLRAASRGRPELLALDLQRQAAALDARAASRWWAPDLRLEGGWKGIDLGSQGRADGFLVGASLAIPLRDRSLGLARIAQGEARATRGRRALLEGELEGELDGAHAEALRLRRAAAALRQQAGAAASELVQIAEAGYAGGELGLLELLDAYRGAADDSLSALDLEHAARRARIELDHLTGAGLP
jgi:outer membrane protein, heavy metal efflux system